MLNNQASTPANHTVEFMLAEFNAIQQRAVHLEEIKSSRINFYLLLVAALITGIATLGTVQNLQKSLYLVASFGAVLSLVAGWYTLAFAADYSIVIVLLYRRAGRIRKWFAMHDPNIEAFLPFEPSDDRPAMLFPYSSFRGAEPIILVANTVSAMAAIAFWLNYLPVVWQWVCVIGIGFITYRVQRGYIQSKLLRAERDVHNSIRFPLQPLPSSGSETSS